MSAQQTADSILASGQVMLDDLDEVVQVAPTAGNANPALALSAAGKKRVVLPHEIEASSGQTVGFQDINDVEEDLFLRMSQFALCHLCSVSDTFARTVVEARMVEAMHVRASYYARTYVRAYARTCVGTYVRTYVRVLSPT